MDQPELTGQHMARRRGR